MDQVYVWNLLGASDESIYFKDLHSRFLRVSRGLAELHGVRPDDLIGLTDFDLFTPEHAARAYADEQRIIATGNPMVNVEERETWLDRPDTWVSTTKLPLRNDKGAIIGTFGISRDITRRVNAEADASRQRAEVALAHAELGRVEAQLRAVLDTATDGIALYDGRLRYQYANAAAERMAGVASGLALGQTDRQLGRDEAFLDIWENALQTVLQVGESCAVDFSLGRGSRLRWFQAHLAAQTAPADLQPIGVVASTREVTELRKAQEDLAHQAVHDPLTGLANRVLMMDRLSQALLRLERRSGRIAVLFVDLDGFKAINDSYGHNAGDRVLVEVAKRLTAVARRMDTVARLGGDEFVMLCHRMTSDDEVRAIADRVVRSVSEAFRGEDEDLCVTASVGVAVTSDHWVSGDDLLRGADAAMYRAKELGRNQHQFFDQDLWSGSYPQ